MLKYSSFHMCAGISFVAVSLVGETDGAADVVACGTSTKSAVSKRGKWWVGEWREEMMTTAEEEIWVWESDSTRAPDVGAGAMGWAFQPVKFETGDVGHQKLSWWCSVGTAFYGWLHTDSKIISFHLKIAKRG